MIIYNTSLTVILGTPYLYQLIYWSVGFITDNCFSGRHQDHDDKIPIKTNKKVQTRAPTVSLAAVLYLACVIVQFPQNFKVACKFDSKLNCWITRTHLRPAEGPNSFHWKNVKLKFILLHKSSRTACSFGIRTFLKQYSCYESATIWYTDHQYLAQYSEVINNLPEIPHILQLCCALVQGPGQSPCNVLSISDLELYVTETSTGVCNPVTD